MNETPTAAIDSGTIYGSMENNVLSFLGIPYAAPAGGDFRWREPQPVMPWEGIRDCSEPGPICPQAEVPGIKGTISTMPRSEDCLNLNVWTSAEAGAKLPVMVWIHGGAFQLGSGSAPLYNGQYLAERGVVVVTINYRLGALGFLAHPLLTLESPHGCSGNYGLLDQIAALDWVRRNIAAFGGDPDNVTIFGESAGAMSVCDLMVSPLVAGLFARAISQSTLFLDHGLLMHATRRLVEAEEIGERYAAESGCAGAPDVLAALRAKPAAELVTALLEIQPGLFMEDARFVPVVDGWVLPDEPGALFAQGMQHDVPLLVGSNTDEGNLFTSLDSRKFERLSVEDYRRKVKEYFGLKAEEILKMFPVNEQEDVKTALSKIFTAFDFNAAARFAAACVAGKGQQAYLYRFSRVPPRDPLGACHGIEVPFIFGNLIEGIMELMEKRSWPMLFTRDIEKELLEALVLVFDKADMVLSGEMMDYWVRFAATGDPNPEGKEEWPAYDKATDRSIEFGSEENLVAGLDKQVCDLADDFYGYTHGE